MCNLGKDLRAENLRNIHNSLSKGGTSGYVQATLRTLFSIRAKDQLN